MMTPIRRNPLLVLLVALAPLLPAARAEQTPQPVGGTLTDQQGVRVLRLHGDAYERGYAHGSLLGDQICQLAVGVLVSPQVWPDVRFYEQTVHARLVPMFRFSPDQQRELEGMLAGVRARVGDDAMRIAALERDIDLGDLKAINVFADIQNGGCTSFAAWGPATRDGGTIVGRNLDFNRLPGLAAMQLLIVRAATPDGGKAWLTVAWPGMIGGYTALNADGVFTAMHDVRVPTNFAAAPFVPRALAIRAIMEKAAPEAAVEQAAELLRASPAFCGNNFLVAAPFRGQDVPAGVLEYDGQTDRDSGASLRTAAWKDNLLPPHTVACTNHYRLRAAPTECNRYGKVRALLLEHPTGEMDLALARKIEASAAVGMTLHTMAANLNARELTLSFGTEEKNASETPSARFTLKELFK